MPAIKQTEAGRIPEDWEARRCVEMGSVVAGKALNVSGPGKIRPYLRTKNIFDGRVDLEDVLCMPFTDSEFERYRLRSGDVLLNEGQSLDLVGRCSMYRDEYPGPCAIQNQLVRFRAKKGVSAAFAEHLFRHCQQSGIFLGIATQTTSVAHLGVSRFSDLCLAWPSLEAEQEAIAGALSDADALIESLEQLLVKKRQLKQGAMQELLTGRKRLPGFSRKWEVRSLGAEVAALDAGVSVNSTDVAADLEPGSAAILKTSCVDRGVFTPAECKRIVPKDISRAKLNPRADTILISRMNTIDLVGECGYVDADYPYLFVPDRLWMTRFRRDSAVSAKWLSYALSSEYCRALLKAVATGTSGSMKNIAKGSLLSLDITFPPLPEQTAIAAILSDMDAEIAALETKLAKARQIKQGMMQELLTGRIRLI